MCEVEPIVVEKTDFIDNEKSAEETKAVVKAITDAQIKKMGDVESAALKLANSKVPGLIDMGAQLRDSTVVSARDNLDTSFRPPHISPEDNLSAQNRTDLETSLNNLAEAIKALRADDEGVLNTRSKLWNFLLPNGMTAAALILSIVSVAFQLIDRNPKDPKTASKPIDTDLPPELIALLEARAEEWHSLPLVDLCDRIRDFMTAYTGSILAQLTIVRDLEVLVAIPGPDPTLDDFDKKTAPGLAVEVESAYLAMQAKPRLVAIYDTVKGLKYNGSALTVPQALRVMELAIGRIYAAVKALQGGTGG
jgi:hypothetical protein